METNDKDMLYRLGIDEGRMMAQLSLTPLDAGYIYDIDEIIEFLNASSVRMGIRNDVIKEMVEQKKYFESYVVAAGQKCIDGQDGYYEYFFDTNIDIKPQIEEDGSVDFLNTKLFEEVKTGDKIAAYTPATNGTFGYDVTGKLLAPRKGKELLPLRGRGFVVSEDKRTYYAAIDGKIEYKFGEINICDVLHIKGDLDMTQSHVRFSGDVMVHGNVASGMIIDTLGSVEIDGHVGGAFIKAGGNIILKKGVQGAEKAVIEAGGNLCGNFFENASLKAGGNIMANYLLNCNSFAKGIIKVYGKRGLILGGVTHGVLGVESHNIGNQAEMPTVIRLGVVDSIMNEYKEVMERIKAIEDELNVLEIGISKLTVLKENKAGDKFNDAYTKMVQARIVKNADKKRCLEKRKELYALITDATAAQLVVNGCMYAGSRLEAGEFTKQIFSRYENSRLQLVDGDFVVLPAN